VAGGKQHGVLAGNHTFIATKQEVSAKSSGEEQRGKEVCRGQRVGAEEE